MRLLKDTIFLLIDEAQYDKNWGISTKIVYDRSKNIFLIVTGSSAISLENNSDVARRSDLKEILPLTYSHHLKLKYEIDLNFEDDVLINTILTGNTDEATEKEKKINKLLINTIDYTDMDWKNYIYYGGFPLYYEEDNNTKIRNNIVKMTKKVVNEDIPNIKNISEENKTNTNRMLRYLALLDAADVSMNKISKYMKTAVANVEKELSLLEKTHLIFHIEAYGTPSFRERKAFKYYFATSSLKYSLASKTGNNHKDKRKFEGVLIENLIASKLFNLTREHENITLFYDARKKVNVDFIVKEEFGKAVPMEVGRGTKDNYQIKNAIEYYNSDFGIVISNTTKNIVKEGNIIYIPIKTFALL